MLPEDNSTQTSDNPSSGGGAAAIGVGGIIAIAFGLLFAILLALTIFSLARKRQRRRLAPPTPKSMAQANFFHKLEADQRAIEAGTWGGAASAAGQKKTNRYTVWGRDSFLFAAPTGREEPRRVMADPSAVWTIKKIEPAVLR